MTRAISACAAALFLTGIATAEMAGPPQPPAVDKYHPEHVLVQFRPFVNDADQAEANKAAGALEVLARYDGNVPGLRLVRVANGDVDAVIARYSANPDVEYAEKDWERYLCVIPNDSSFNQLWGMHNTGQTVNGDPGTANIDIDAPAAWDFWTGDANYRVAVIDTGITLTHPDLQPNIWVNPGEIPNNNIDDDGNGRVDDVNGYDFINNDPIPNDDYSPIFHGSHCSGTIAGVGNNATGVVGVNWRCKIVSLKIFNSGGSTNDSAIIAAIEYCRINSIPVSNNSWGGGPYSQSTFNSIQATQQVGHLFVAAAGNFSGNNDSSAFYPATYNLPNIISVMAIENSGNNAGFTNYGATTVDLGAPGVNVYSCASGSGYQFLDGTSMATPHVTGVVALLRSQVPGMPWQDVKTAIMNSTRPLASLNGRCVTGGLLNAYNALLAADCNTNGTADPIDITSGASSDCNVNNRPDECELSTNDCNANGTVDGCEGTDCDNDGVRDFCQLAGRDCNQNGIYDLCELANNDCNFSRVPDDCELANNDCDLNARPDDCQPDCNRDGVIDVCAGQPDCNTNNIPDNCDIVPALPPRRVPNLPIPDANTAGVSDTINILDAGPVLDVNVTVDILHTAVSHLTLRLVHGTRNQILFRGRCSQFDNLNITIDDAGAFINCLNLQGTYRPNSMGGSPLSNFNNMEASGAWRLIVSDTVTGQVGTFRSWTLAVRTASQLPPSSDANGNGVPDECETICACRGDLTGDSTVDGGDLQMFIASIMGANNVCSDMNADGQQNSADVSLMVTKLLSSGGCAP